MLTEVDFSVGVSLQPDLNANHGVIGSFGNVQQRVDARLIEDKLLIINGVEGASSHSVA